jgi:hypothetical protein
MKEIDSQDLSERIRKIDAKLCTVELRPVLPAPIFEDLANHAFEPIRQSLRVAFAHWLGE